MALASLLAMSLLACTPDGERPRAVQSSASGPAVLDFAVYGSPAMIAAYTRIASDYTATHPDVVINVRPRQDHGAAMSALQTTATSDPADLPEIFQVAHEDLGWLRSEKAIEPVDKVLVDREVDFGDGFPRSGLDAFTADARLQCLPTEVSPLVAYVNTDLIDLPQLLGDDDGAYNALRGWSLEKVTEAATEATRNGGRGIALEPSIEQLAPMLLSGGGTVVDDDTDPTSLALADDSNRDALNSILQLVRNPRLTFNQKQLAQRSAVERFQRGRLGIVFGYRDLTAKLRQQGGLNFAVLPVPRLGPQVTVARTSAMCMPKQSKYHEQIGDFMAYLVSTEAMQTLTATGEFVPSNLDVVNSPAFTQPNLMPQNAGVFADQVRRVQFLPDSDGWPQVYVKARKPLTALFNDPVIEPLDERLTAIDEASAATLRTVRDAESASTASPAPSPTPSS